MTDKKISELNELTQASVTDLIAVVNGAETKKITALNWVNSSIPLDAVLFNIAATPPLTTEGIVFYDAIEKTISLRTELSDVTLQVGQELQVRVKNETGGTLDNGAPVYITGVSGGFATVDLAQADDPSTSVVFGLLTASLDDGEIGRVTVFGKVRELDTSGFAAGERVYLSAANPGELVSTAPSAPSVLSIVGTVEVSDASDGTILVNNIVNSADLDQRYPTKIVQGWSFGSPSATTGTFYAGGYYDFGPSSNDFSPSITLGTANSSYAAHISFVLGEDTVDELTLRVTGTSINDQGTRTPGDTQDIVIPNATSVNAYYETTKKWLGQVTISVVSGTPKLCNYGFSKYWDDNNTNFTLLGVEAVWLAGANDAAANISVIHHKSTGWTYGAGGTPTPPYVSRMNTDHVTEINLVNGEMGAWKRDNLSIEILGGDSEGVIIEVFTSANRAFDINSNINITVSPL
jgi:hypothetical protein